MKNHMNLTLLTRKSFNTHAAKGLESKIVIFAQSYLKNNLMKDKVYPISH